jgi:hypothetical protein
MPLQCNKFFGSPLCKLCLDCMESCDITCHSVVESGMYVNCSETVVHVLFDAL